MLTKKVKKRILFLVSIVFLTAVSIFFIFKVLNDNLLYFKTPTEIKKDENLDFQRAIRIGGMVKQNSLSATSKEIKFIITDMKNEIIVSYSGAIPNLFAEGKGVVAEGKLKDRNYFIAEKILAKHDENYMPPELKKNVK